MKNREAFYDQLRVLAIFSIICCHVTASFVVKNTEIMSHFKTFYATSFINLGRYIGVPLFVMLSGALLINKDYSFFTFFKKRLSRVFIPYIFWVVIFILFSVFFLKADITADFLFKLIFGLKGTVGRILWFVWMLLVVYIAIFIINKILEYGKSKSDKFEKRFIALLVIASVICYIMDNFGFFSHGDYIIFYSLFIPCAIFGYYLTHTDFTNIKNFNITPDMIVIFAFIISVLGYLYFVFDVCINSIATNKFSPGSYFGYVILLVLFSIILFFRYLPQCNGNVAEKVNGFLTSGNIAKAILSISICSYGIYFAHYLILNVLQITFLGSFDYYNHPKLWIPVLLVTVSLSSWVLIWIMGKIPYLNKLSGAS